MTEQVQAEAGVAEEGEVGTGVGERDRGVGMAQELAHLVLVGVEQAAVEHRVQLAVEAEVEEHVERMAPGLLGQRPDRLALQVTMLGRASTSMIVRCGHVLSLKRLGTPVEADSSLSASRNDGSARTRRYAASSAASMAGRQPRNASSG